MEVDVPLPFDGVEDTHAETERTRVLPSVDVLCGDVIDTLRELPEGSVHCVISSPPYYGLRSYNIPPRHWDDGTECVFGDEPTVELYVQHSVQVLREVKRVLHPRGSVWWNLGDCYAGGGRHPERKEIYAIPVDAKPKRPRQKRLSGKCLLQVPARVSLALVEDGWILRQANVWAKALSFCPGYSGSVMPESTRDRTTWAYEMVYHLTLRENAFYDQDGYREPYAASTRAQLRSKYTGVGRKAYAEAGAQNPSDVKRRVLASAASGAGRNLRNVWVIPKQNFLGFGDTSHFACVDEETQALTPSGWKSQDLLTDGDVIAAFNQETSNLEWQQATFYRYEDAPIWKWNKRDLSMALTPNHRCIVLKKQNNRANKRSVVRAADLTGRHSILTSASFLERDAESSSSIGTLWASLVGWYITEGHKSKHRKSTVEIYQSQSANPQHVETIRYLLTNVGATWKEYSHTRLWAYKGKSRLHTMITFRITGDVAIRLMQLAPDKELTPQLVWLPKNDAIALFLALVSGDGSRRRDDGRQSFIQKSLDCAEWAQILGIRLGFRAIISKRTGNTYVVYYTTGGWLTMRGTNGVAPVHTVSKGRVWCPSVESGFWLARRNGKPFITGNTFPERLPEIVIRLATSAHGVCEVCLEPWRRRVTRETVPAHVHERFEAARAVTATETGRTDGHTMKRPNYRRKVLREEWEAGCQCGRGVIPATVCDPFLGSGRSAIVAKRLGRSFIGIDINASYVEMAKRAVEEAV